MLGKTVISRAEITDIVARLAAEIERDLQGRDPVFVCVLKGCAFFFCDLTRSIKAPLEVDFVQVSSYGASTTSSGTVVLVKDITTDVRGRDVYLVEDIVDTGCTLSDLIQLMHARHPRSIKVVSLLSKPARRKIDVEIDFLGREIDDLFVVGYGLDFDEKMRNLPEICEWTPDSEDG